MKDLINTPQKLLKLSAGMLAAGIGGYILFGLQSFGARAADHEPNVLIKSGFYLAIIVLVASPVVFLVSLAWYLARRARN